MSLTKVVGSVFPFEDSLSSSDGYKYIGEVLSISDLRGIEPTIDKQKIKVKSYYLNVPFGGGDFYYDSTDTTSSDNGGTVIVTAGNKRWKRIFKELWLEDFGGGMGLDDADIMEIAQSVATSPIKVQANKTYFFTHAVKHKSNSGWIGKNTTFKCITSGSRMPFITSLKTQTGVTNDAIHGTSGVNSVYCEGIIFDTDYKDTNGVLGFQFAENTLDNWTYCTFKNCTFTNSKFDNMALQNNCDRVVFDGCTFSNAGQDGITIRHTCSNTVLFNRTKIISTALVTLSGAKSGDGVVNKGNNTLIDGCYFYNIGNGIKGAGIANNAEDVDTVQQASYGTYTNNLFVNCYGGLGIGTVKPDFISAGTYIEGIVCSNNTFINTNANAIGVRYVSNISLSNNIIIGQTLQAYNAVELIYVTGHQGNYQVKNAVGGALLIQNSNGKISMDADTVSTAGALNGFTISACNTIDIDLNIKNVTRRLGTISTTTNSKIKITGSNATLSGIDLTSVTNSEISIKISEIAQYGILSTTSSNNIISVIANNISTGTNAGYTVVDFFSGSTNIVDIISTSTATNKPNYDITVRAANTDVILRSCIYKAGATARTNIVAGATVLKGTEIV